MATCPYLSLFAGAGGLDLALRIAVPEAHCIGRVENDITVSRILAARITEGVLEDCPQWSDVRTFPSRLYRGRVAGIIGGFPCTDLSLAGKRAGIRGEASGLWWEYLRIAEETDPDWVLIENVPGLLGEPGCDLESDPTEDGEPADWIVRNIDAVLGPLSDLRFDAQWLTLRAVDVGAAQERSRVFILAYRSDRGCEECGHSLADSYGGRRQARDRGCEVGDSVSARLEGRAGERSHTQEECSPTERGSYRLFPPGQGRWRPAGTVAGKQGSQYGWITCVDGRAFRIAQDADAEAWCQIVRDAPWLAPAIEPGLCVLASGQSLVVDQDHTDQLRASGNQVVALCGAVAIGELRRRAGRSLCRISTAHD